MTKPFLFSGLLSASTLLYCIVLIGILCNHQVLSLNNQVLEDTPQEAINVSGAGGGGGTSLIPPMMIEPDTTTPQKRSLAVTITADMQQMLDLGKKTYRFAKLIRNDFSL